MNADDLRSLVRRKVDEASDYHEEELSAHRLKALDYYYGEPFGTEVEGRSKVVMTEVADTIEFIMPSLMRIYAAGDVGEFVPTGPEDVEGAKQATDWCDYVLNRKNLGFCILHDAFKDGLLNKIGVTKSYWEEKEDATEETYEGQPAFALEALSADPEVEILETVEVEGEEPTYDITVRKTERYGCIVIENVPGEEFLVERRAKWPIQKMRFCAHRTTKTVSDLVAMGYDRDVVEEYAGASEEDQEPEKQNRFQDIESSLNEDEENDVVFTEVYMRVDFDDDGIDELRRIRCIGESCHVLDNEPWDRIPFDTGSPILMPHRLIGRSLAELVMDLQLIKSTLVRQMLDNFYANNNATMEAVEGKVNLDDLLNPAPGGVVRVSAPGMLNPVRPPPMIGEAMPMIELLDKTREQRTGITKASAGLDADALQSSTQAAVLATLRAAEGKVEMIARVFGETLVRGLFESIFHLTQKHVDSQQMIRLRGKFVPIDPRAWANKYDFEVKVGLGTGQAQERIGALSMLAQKQELVLTTAPENPIVKPWHYAATLNELARLSGFKDTQTYFAQPEDVAMEMQQKAMQPPQPDPQMQLEAQRAQQQADLDRWKAETKAALDEKEMEWKMRLREQELNFEMRLRSIEAAAGGNPSPNLPRGQ